MFREGEGRGYAVDCRGRADGTSSCACSRSTLCLRSRKGNSSHCPRCGRLRDHAGDASLWRHFYRNIWPDTSDESGPDETAGCVDARLDPEPGGRSPLFAPSCCSQLLPADFVLTMPWRMPTLSCSSPPLNRQRMPPPLITCPAPVGRRCWKERLIRRRTQVPQVDRNPTLARRLRACE